jgi:DNA modification methylase
MQRNKTPLQSQITSQDQPEYSVGEMPHPRNTLNDMSGDRFLYFTKSVLSTSYPSVYSHELRKKHGANKPPQLMALLIEFFTKTGMSVLDPFAGVGGTLIGASIATPGARTCVGIEINHQWTDIYTRVLKDNSGLLPQTMIQGDCIEVMDRLLAHKSILDIEGREVRAP